MYYFFNFFSCPSLFWLHFNPGVHIISFQIILFYLATGPHLHAVGQVAAPGSQDEVVNQGSAGSSDDRANPEDLKRSSKPPPVNTSGTSAFEAVLKIFSEDFLHEIYSGNIKNAVYHLNIYLTAWQETGNFSP